MKAVLSIFLMFAYLFSTMGLSVSIHECGGEKSYSFWGLSLNACCECDHESTSHDDDCCKDKKVNVKGDQKEKMIPKVQFAKQELQAILSTPTIAFTERSELLSEFEAFAFGAEYPRDHSPPLYLLHHSFLI